jgi:hypothetical protein
MIRTIGRIPAERATSYEIRKVFEHPDAEERLPLERLPIFAATNHAHDACDGLLNRRPQASALCAPIQAEPIVVLRNK